jgi:hypothetical protein
MAVAVPAELAAALVAEPAEELVDLSGQRLLQQALRALADELLEDLSSGAGTGAVGAKT